MKKWALSFLLFWFVDITCAQIGNMPVETFILSNGFKLVLCEDHSKPEIYGGVYVHAGSFHDPEDATGIAHYFEHIMFKGTDKIGTMNWESEKIYLDSITFFYDLLHETTDERKRKEIQYKINELSIEAANYAIPNEINTILGKMGGENINAFTDYNATVYYNTFPSNQLEKWMLVYTERFRNPVFRLFQSELETVYEEKNMYADNMFSVVGEDILKTFFGDHPYGRPILGYTEHLKNPRISKMEEFFRTYYVANNMTLILVGDFNTEEVKKMAENAFGTLRHGEVPAEPEYTLPKLDGRVEVVKRLTPVKAGVIGYRTCNAGHEDHYRLKLLSSIFSNQASTGLLDRLSLENKLYMTQVLYYTFRDQGAIGFLFIPKILGQSLKNAENLIWECIDQVKQGKFSNDLFEAIKMEYIAEHIQGLENMENKFRAILQNEMDGNEWEDYLDELDKMRKLSKEDLVTVANKYLADDYLVYYTKMGFPKKDKISKPDWKPVTPRNVELSSVFAQEIEKYPVKPISSQEIDFNKDVTILPLTDGYSLYVSPNPFNDIFSLSIHFQYGTLTDRYLDKAVEYINLQGTGTKTYEEFNMALQKLGGKLALKVSDAELIVNISGFENNMEEILHLCHDKIFRPGNDESRLKTLIQDQRMNSLMVRRDARSMAVAVYEYANFGDSSRYLTRPSVTEMKSWKGEDLHRIYQNALQYDGYITFVGNQEANKVRDYLREIFPLNSNPKKGNYITRNRKKWNEDIVFMIHNRKFLQSNIYFTVYGNRYTGDQDRVAGFTFNQYFGSNMYSLVFQEIREFRSLAYSSAAYYNYVFLNKDPGYLLGFVGTQSDKTVEAINVMQGLIKDMPEKPEKYATAKEALLQSNHAHYIDFRNIPANVHYWKQQGYDRDPRPVYNELIEKMNFQDMLEFYRHNIHNRPIVITLSGNMQRIDKTQLENFGKVHKLRLKDILKK